MINTSEGSSRTGSRLSASILGGGIVLVASSVALYVTGWSRAIAVALLPVAALLLAVGGIAVKSGRAPNRLVVVGLTVLLLLLAALGVAGWIYSLLHQPTGV